MAEQSSQSFMVLGIHWEPIARENTEADNPYLWSLPDAVAFAQTQEYAVVVRLDEIFEVNNMCQA
jgi:hypothetical protein